MNRQTSRPMWERFVLDRDHPSGKPVLNGVNKTDCFLKLREYENLGSIEEFRRYKDAGTADECIAARRLCEELPYPILKSVLTLIHEIDVRRMLDQFSSMSKNTANPSETPIVSDDCK